MRNMRRLMTRTLAAVMVFSFLTPVYAADQTPDQTPDQQLETLQQENDELRAQVETLIKELEELKNQGNEDNPDSQAEQPELPENVANADTTVQYTDVPTIKIVQETLNAAGYNCGAPDGVAGTKTTEQINRYETEHGLVVNGIITEQLLESLGIAEKLEEQAKIEAEKASYSGDFTYEQLARNPDVYVDRKFKFSGKVLQVGEGSNGYLRVAMNSSYDTVIFVTFDSGKLSYRLLEDDMVTVYGTSQGIYSYEAVSGATISIPCFDADYIDLN